MQAESCMDMLLQLEVSVPIHPVLSCKAPLSEELLMTAFHCLFGPVVSSPVNETRSKVTFWLQVGPDAWRLAGPPTRSGALFVVTL